MPKVPVKTPLLLRLRTSALLITLAASSPACVGDRQEGPESRSGEVGEGEEVALNVKRTGILTLEGEPLAAAGEFELQAACSYSRSAGAFSFSLIPDSEEVIEKGPQGFSVAAGRGPRSSIPLEDGTYQGEFEYNEVVGDGTVPTYLGDAELSLSMVDDSREHFPIFGVTARGEGEGVRFRVEGRCQVMVGG
jgi:hypothetical protein